MTRDPENRSGPFAATLLSPIAESGARTVKPFLPAALAQHVNY